MSHHLCHIIIHTCRHIIIPVVYLCPDDTEEEEEGLFKANVVNEEDPERDRATQV
jgi:hypothetical protein